MSETTENTQSTVAEDPTPTPIVTVAELKKQMNVDHNDDDTYITNLGTAALASVIFRTRRTETELKQMNGGTFPEGLRLATMMLAAHWYRVREAVSSASQNAVPYSLEYLIRPWTRLGATRTENSDD